MVRVGAIQQSEGARPLYIGKTALDREIYITDTCGEP